MFKQLIFALLVAAILVTGLLGTASAAPNALPTDGPTVTVPGLDLSFETGLRPRCWRHNGTGPYICCWIDSSGTIAYCN